MSGEQAHDFAYHFNCNLKVGSALILRKKAHPVVGVKRDLTVTC